MTGRLRALDGLRGLLALYILAGHTAPFLRLPPSVGWTVSLLSHGRGAVEVFFVLSGMVIFRSHGAGSARVGARQFLVARAGRLLPVYGIALIAAAAALSCGDPFQALPWLASDAAHDIAEAVWPQPWLAHLAAHVTLTQGLFPAAVLPDVEFTILGPAWSLSTEWQFYLIVAAMLARRRSRWAGADDWRAFAGVMAAVGGVGLLVDLLPVQWQPGRSFLPHEAWYFAFGIASHGLLTTGGKRAARWWWMALLGAACLLSWRQAPLTASAAPLLWVVCLACEAPGGWALFRPLGAALKAAPLQWLGRISYPLYLIHIPVQRLLMLAVAHGAGARPILFSELWGPAAILAPLLVAYALHRWVETPCWRWARQYAERPHAGQPRLSGTPPLLPAAGPLGRRRRTAHQPIDG